MAERKSSSSGSEDSKHPNIPVFRHLHQRLPTRTPRERAEIIATLAKEGKLYYAAKTAAAKTRNRELRDAAVKFLLGRESGADLVVLYNLADRISHEDYHNLLVKATIDEIDDIRVRDQLSQVASPVIARIRREIRRSRVPGAPPRYSPGTPPRYSPPRPPPPAYSSPAPARRMPARSRPGSPVAPARRIRARPAVPESPPALVLRPPPRRRRRPRGPPRRRGDLSDDPLD